MIKAGQYLAALNAAGMRLFDARIVEATHQGTLAPAVGLKVLIRIDEDGKGSFLWD